MLVGPMDPKYYRIYKVSDLCLDEIRFWGFESPFDSMWLHPTSSFSIADSDRVWKEVVLVDDSGVGQDWYKATIQINARATEPWTAQAIKPDGSLGTIYRFQRK